MDTKTHEGMATFFETALIRVPPLALRSMSALENARWDGCATIKEEDVWAAVAADNFPIMDRVGNWDDGEIEYLNYECNYDDHVQRIAWLVKNWDATAAMARHPITLRLDDSESIFSDGNHRIVAAIIRNEPHVTIEVGLGSAARIQEVCGDVEWLRKPVGRYFGFNVVVSNSGEMWEVDCAQDKLWINNTMGFCQLQLSFGRLTSSARVVSSPEGDALSKFITNAELSLNSIVDACSAIISPAFASHEFREFLVRMFPRLA